MNDCIFCKIASRQIPADIFYEDENSVAFLDIKPINPGHTLIVPKKHVDHFFDVPQPLYGQMFDVARLLAPILKEAMGTTRTGLAIEGFGIAHAHLHLVPINHGHELNPERAKPATPEELNKVRDEIKKRLH